MGSDERANTSLLAAAEAGDDLAMQYAMRIIVANEIQQGCPARELAALTKRLKEINAEIKELEALKAEEDDDPSDTPPEAWDAAAI